MKQNILYNFLQYKYVFNLCRTDLRKSIECKLRKKEAAKPAAEKGADDARGAGSCRDVSKGGEENSA